MLKKILLFFSFLFLSVQYICADEFFPEGDSSLNRYYDTIAYGIGEMPENLEVAGGVEYDEGEVVGDSTHYLMSNVMLGEMAYPDPTYGLIRIPNSHNNLFVPPNAKVDFVYWGENFGDEDVYISNIKMFLSRAEPYRGDILKLLNMSGVYESVDLKYVVWNYPRSGYTKTYEGLGIIDQYAKVSPFVLDSAYVKPALEFKSWSAVIDGDFAEIEIGFQNTSDYLLNNVEFIHNEFHMSRDYQPGEEYSFKYIIAYDGSGSLGYAGLRDPNIEMECVALGENISSNVVGDSLIVTSEREEGSDSAWVIGSRVKQASEGFCITRIPYTIYSEVMALSVENEVLEEIIEDVIDTSETGSDIGNVLGIKKLPQTSYFGLGNILSLLVGGSFLWYYFKRR